MVNKGPQSPSWGGAGALQGGFRAGSLRLLVLGFKIK